MNQGKVYWITGLAGAGKTTIGNALYVKLREITDSVVILDGDILKQMVGTLVGYSYEERKQRAKSYSNFCRVLAEQGINVIICTIAMFDSVREWNRNNIENYYEIFIDVPMEILKERNKKALYSDSSNVVGIDVPVELPKNPDICITNDGSISVEDIVKEILLLKNKNRNLYINDTLYWDNYYKQKNNAPIGQSSFAEYVDRYIKTGKKLLDLGCGNGRDSIYFLEKGLEVTGIDASQEAIKKLKSIGNGRFVCGDFICFRTLFQEQYDYCYSRFTLHAINEKQEDELLKNVNDTLPSGGYFFIEARTTNDSIYGEGEAIGKHEYINNGHYRRFIDVNAFKKKIVMTGNFEIVEINESVGWARTKDSDPTLMRCILMKK